MKAHLPALGFVGAGRAGTALVRACVDAGYGLAGVADRRREAVTRAYRFINRPCRWMPATRVAAESDVLFLTVPDREVVPLYRRIGGLLRPGAIVVHCSGYFGAEVFQPVGRRRIETLAFHPVQSFPVPKETTTSLAGCTFVLDGSRAGLQFGRMLSRGLKGASLVLAGADRPLYHAMCVFASNFQHALAESAGCIARRIGLSPSRANRLLAPLARTTLENLLARGTGPGLTGPVLRGDVGTVAGHLSALRARAPELAPLYIELTRRLIVLARGQGTDCRDLQVIGELLDA